MRSLNVIRILLDLKDLDRDEKARADLVGAVLKQAPQSQLFAKSPTFQVELRNLGATYDTFLETGTEAAATAARLKSDLAAHDEARVANNKSLNLLRGKGCPATASPASSPARPAPRSGSASPSSAPDSSPPGPCPS